MCIYIYVYIRMYIIYINIYLLTYVLILSMILISLHVYIYISYIYHYICVYIYIYVNIYIYICIINNHIIHKPSLHNHHPVGAPHHRSFPRWKRPNRRKLRPLSPGFTKGWEERNRLVPRKTIRRG